MNKVLIAYDERDTELGGFFELCANDIYTTLNNSSISVIIEAITTQNLNESYIKEIIGNDNKEGFIFIAYSHGSKSALHCTQQYSQVYVSDQNISHFGRSAFYTFSCSAGHTLGPALFSKGCSFFWGYKSEASIVTTFENEFVECANSGFKKLLEGSTLNEAYNAMIDKYNEHIDTIENPLAEIILLDNRRALVLFCNDMSKRLSDSLS